MALPHLTGFSGYIHTIHQAILLFGAICHVTIPKQKNWIHIATEPYAWGFQSQQFPKGGRLLLNVLTAEMQIQHGDGNTTLFSLADHTQKSLFAGILEALATDELAESFAEKGSDDRFAALLGHIHKVEDKLAHAIAEHSHETELSYDTSQASEYMQALDAVFTGIARWRGRLNGHLSPMVVWAEHFDLSTIWFATPEMDEYKAHINIGFAPFTDSMFERPYLYAYAYPMREDATTPDVTAPLKWETEAYTGIYVAYDDLLDYDDPVATIETLCTQMFAALQSVLA